MSSVTEKTESSGDSSSVLSFMNGLNCYIIQSSSGEKKKKVSDKQIWAVRFHYVESTRSNVSDWPSADDVRRERGGRGRTGEDGAENREDWSERQKVTQTCGRATIRLHLQLRAVRKAAVMMERQWEQTTSQFRGVCRYGWINKDVWILVFEFCSGVVIFLSGFRLTEEEEEEIMKVCCWWFNSEKFDPRCLNTTRVYELWRLTSGSGISSCNQTHFSTVRTTSEAPVGLRQKQRFCFHVDVLKFLDLEM